MSALSDLQAAQGRLEGLSQDPGVDPIELADAINSALAPAPPSGSPTDIQAQAQAYRTASQACSTVSADLARTAGATLPAAWRGQSAENAAEAIQALSTEVATTERNLGLAADALEVWAGHVTWAQEQDQQGVAQLRSALAMLSGASLTASGPEQKALPPALSGVAARVAGAGFLAENAPATVALLTQYTLPARAQEITTGDVDPLSAVVLSNAANPGGSLPGGDILSPTALTRASSQLDGMSAADQQTFETMLAQCGSPQEAAYLWKGLASGYPISMLQQFDAAIRPYGNDPAWLAQHLDVDLTNSSAPDNGQPVTYAGSAWPSLDPGVYMPDVYDQGQHPDCVAASTVIAKASMDPLFMLSLTTGFNMPTSVPTFFGMTPVQLPAAGDDSAAALQQRLQFIYQAEYTTGQGHDSVVNQIGDFFGSSGIGSDGTNYLANTLLDPSTGGSYQYQGLNSAADRQAALAQINASVDSGKPVPLDVTGSSGGHQMMIIARKGDLLEVYNPWGQTQWVTDSQFVNSNLGSLTPGDNLPTADGVELPK